MRVFVIVNVNPLPQISVSSPSSAVCKGQEVVLTASGALTYQWNTGENVSQILVNPETNTGYHVTGTDANGCSDIVFVTIEVNDCSGIEPVNLESMIKAFPNPFLDSFRLYLQGDAEISVLNATGQIILKQKVHSAAATIDLSAYANGVYLVEVSKENQFKRMKLIKQ